jgi:hypothetical protein
MVITIGGNGSPDVAARSDCPRIWNRGRWMTSHLKRGQKPHIARDPPSEDTASATSPVQDFDFLVDGDIMTGIVESQWSDFHDYIL